MHENNRFLHDLLWAVNSPLLMDLHPERIGLEQPLKATEVDCDHLNTYLTKRRERRVGKYFEQLIYYWIRFIRGCEILADSLQLRDGKQTLGEIDLLFRDEHGRINHWELACKFYLQTSVGEDARTEYIGPNAKDTLRQKSRRLLEHQLPLGVQHFPKIQVQRAFLKGRIFYCGRPDRIATPSDGLTADHQRGRWIRAQNLSALFRDNDLRYRILRKPFWLADEWMKASDQTLNRAETIQVLRDHFQSRDTPMLISEFGNVTPTAKETERWFIVNDQWPHSGERD